MDKNEQILLAIQKEMEKLCGYGGPLEKIDEKLDKLCGYGGPLEKIDEKLDKLFLNQEKLLKQLEEIKPSSAKGILEAIGFAQVILDLSEIKDILKKRSD